MRVLVRRVLYFYFQCRQRFSDPSATKPPTYITPGEVKSALGAVTVAMMYRAYHWATDKNN